MKTVSFPAGHLLSILKRNKIATMSELKNALGTNSSVTVFRKLKELNYITSCSHSGKYYSLKRIVRFNRIGIWFFNSVLFSSYGTLSETLKALTEESERGYTSAELEKLLNIKPNGPLLELISKGKIRREKIFGTFVYFSKNSTVRKRQELNRKDCVRGHDSINNKPDTVPNELKAALIIFFSVLNEKQRRLYAGLESLKVGHGGDKLIAELFDTDKKTVARGRRELLSGKVDADTVREPGGGRKKIKKKFRM